MAKGKTNSLLDQLGKSMEKKKPTPAQAPKTTLIQDSGAGKNDSNTSEKRERVKSKNLSLYSEDFKRIKDIQDIIYDSTGNLPNASLAVRIALRSCSLERTKLRSIYEEIKNQDSRTKS